MVKCLPEFEYFYCIFEKKHNFISNIRRSKVTDFAALNLLTLLVLDKAFIKTFLA